MSASANLLAVTLAVIGSAGLVALAASKPAAGGFAAQAQTGRGEYGVSCALCHGPKLLGGAGPALAGPNFISAWGEKSTQELYRYISSSMPAGNPGSLSPSSYLELTAFILQANGVKLGAQPLTATTDFKIATIVNGQEPPSVAPDLTAPAQAGQAAPDH
ncbi:MAG: cytochrome c [Steroidobacteraceae bacterium]|jgi:mono/diheme cytochrome c family protein